MQDRRSGGGGRCRRGRALHRPWHVRALVARRQAGRCAGEEHRGPERIRPLDRPRSRRGARLVARREDTRARPTRRSGPDPPGLGRRPSHRVPGWQRNAVLGRLHARWEHDLVRGRARRAADGSGRRWAGTAVRRPAVRELVARWALRLHGRDRRDVRVEIGDQLARKARVVARMPYEAKGASGLGWLGDGSAVLYNGSASPGAELWAMRADGGGQRRLGGKAVMAPAWSRDGTKLAYASGDPAGGSRIVVADARGRKLSSSRLPRPGRSRTRATPAGRRTGRGSPSTTSWPPASRSWT